MKITKTFRRPYGSNENGQVLVEFALWAVLFSIALVVTYPVFQSGYISVLNLVTTNLGIRYSVGYFSVLTGGI